MKPETLARLILLSLLSIAAAIGYFALRAPVPAARELHARMPENGGWSETTLFAAAGQPLRLRLTSDDVLHSFAIGQSSAAPIDLRPGEWAETTLVFDQPGRYTYYCTRWCGANHWRMRGTIVVTGDASPAAAETNTKPLYLRLGLDVDLPHLAENIPAAAPSAERGAALAERLGGALPAWALDRQAYLETSPSALWQRLSDEASLRDLTAAELWDLVAYLQARQATPAALAEAAALYATNCAACHGETGKGDGVMVEGLPRYQPGTTHTSPTTGQPGGADPDAESAANSAANSAADPGAMTLSAPPDFTDPRVLLGASPALLEGKMLRGGMGTGMPYWGPIFTPTQTDAIIAYLYTFALKK